MKKHASPCTYGPKLVKLTRTNNFFTKIFHGIALPPTKVVPGTATAAPPMEPTTIDPPPMTLILVTLTFHGNYGPIARTVSELNGAIES